MGLPARASVIRWATPSGRGRDPACRHGCDRGAPSGPPRGGREDRRGGDSRAGRPLGPKLQFRPRAGRQPRPQQRDNVSRGCSISRDRKHRNVKRCQKVPGPQICSYPVTTTELRTRHPWTHRFGPNRNHLNTIQGKGPSANSMGSATRSSPALNNPSIRWSVRPCDNA